MKKLIFPLVVLIITFYACRAQQKNFWNSTDAYLGQISPNDTPKVFADKMLVPDSGMAMDRCAFSADGKEFYYLKAQHWFNSKGSKLRYFKYDGKKWQGPFDFLSNGYYAPTFSPTGRDLYLIGGPQDGVHSFVWIIHRTAEGWTSPGIYLKKDYGLYDFMQTRSGTCYVGSNAHQGNRKNYQTYDFCSIRFNGKDTVIESLGPTINTPGFDGDFYVAPDESYMVISYKEKPDYECELGITFRKTDHTWSAPINLGPLINNGDAHRWGEYVSPDGKYLFYSKGTSEKDCHLYWVRFDKLKKRLSKQVN